MLLAARHLWCHERGSVADDRPIGADAHLPRAPEVGELGAAVGANHDVARLDVVVHNGLPVEVC
jgi:hypothetical protein